MILTNKRAMFATLAAMFAMLFMLFFESILADRLIEKGIKGVGVGKYLLKSKINIHNVNSK